MSGRVCGKSEMCVCHCVCQKNCRVTLLVLVYYAVWLSQSLMQHYHHGVATEAKKLEQPLPKLETDLAAQLDTNVDDVGIVESHFFMCINVVCVMS